MQLRTGGCTDTVRESALKVDSEKKKILAALGLKPVSVLHLAFQSDALPTHLSQSQPLGNVVCEKKGLGYSRTLCEKERGVGNDKTIKQFIGIPHTTQEF